MTYRDLLWYLNHISKEQLTSDVTVKIDDEFFDASWVISGPENDVLDEGHPYLSADTYKGGE